MMAKENPNLKFICAVFGIVILELYALSCGINGTLYSGVIIILAGMGGYKVTAMKSKLKEMVGNGKEETKEIG